MTLIQSPPSGDVHLRRRVPRPPVCSRAATAVPAGAPASAAWCARSWLLATDEYHRMRSVRSGGLMPALSLEPAEIHHAEDPDGGAVRREEMKPAAAEHRDQEPNCEDPRDE